METLYFLQVIGRGAFGCVWKCQCKTTGGLFAVKEYRFSKDNQKNIHRELQPLLTLRHDNLVKVFKWFFEQETLHGVFELLDHDLLQDIRESSSGLDSVVLKKYTYQILRAVDFLHSVNIVHRDIKPDNVLVSKAGVLKLADLGLSSKADSKVNKGLTVGTLPYMAPEILLMDCDSYKHSDVWAVGCTILAMARGTVLFKRRHRYNVIWNIVSTIGYLTPRQRQQFVLLEPGKKLPKPQTQTVLTEKYMVHDQHLAKVIEGCLQMDPLERASCDQLLNDEYFTNDQFIERFLIELKEMVCKDDGNTAVPCCSQPQSDSNLSISNPLKVPPPEQIDYVEAISEIENLEEKQDGKKEESAVNEERPAKEEVKRKRGFRAAIRRTLTAIRRRFSFLAGTGEDRRRVGGGDVWSGSLMRVNMECMG